MTTKVRDDNDAAGPRVPTNERLLLIVEVIAEAGRALTPTEINARIGLPKQSIHRLCSSLLQMGFLQRSADPKRLEPATRLRRLASGLSQASGLDVARHQILLRVARVVREAVNFVIPEQAGMRYLDRVDTDWPFRVQLPIGTVVPFHCTASGKTFLASLPVRRRTQVVGNLTLTGMARNTFVEQTELLEELHLIAEQGYALDNEEFMDDLVAIAVPVLDANGRYQAALAFHGPRQRVTVESAVAQVNVLRDGASALARLLRDEGD